MNTKYKMDIKFIDKCDNCGTSIYDYDIYYKATIGRNNYILCKDCCQLTQTITLETKNE